MDGLFPPTALYLILAVSVALSAKGAAERAKMFPSIDRWELWLYQAPIFAAMLHLIGYVVFQLFLFDQLSTVSSRVNLIMHGVTLILAAIAGAWSFARQLLRAGSEPAFIP